MTSAAKNYQPEQAALAGLSEEEAILQVANNASMSGFNTAFWLATALSIVGLALSFFLSSKPKTKEQQEKKLLNYPFSGADPYPTDFFRLELTSLCPFLSSFQSFTILLKIIPYRLNHVKIVTM